MRAAASVRVSAGEQVEASLARRRARWGAPGGPRAAPHVYEVRRHTKNFLRGSVSGLPKQAVVGSSPIARST